MGVKWLARWQPPAGCAPSTSDEVLLVRAIESLGARPSSDKRDWELTCRLLKQAPAASAAVAQTRTGGTGGTMKDMWLIQSSESADTCCLVGWPDFHVLEADKMLTDMLERKLEYRTRTWVKYEGKKYTFGDFSLVLATTTTTSSNHQATQDLMGHVVEVEYRPLSHSDVAAPIMADLVLMLRDAVAAVRGDDDAARGTQAGSLELVGIPFEKYAALPATFGRQHVAVSYARLSMVLARR